MSYWKKPMDAAKSAVSAPVNAITAHAVDDKEKSQERRAMRYTPAVTMVAAWMSALTGVGPAMASGSHTKSGICALFPTAPTKRRRHAIVITPTLPHARFARKASLNAF